MVFDQGYEIGTYRVVRMLGQGGMGDVYEVEHVGLHTHYALKAFSCDEDKFKILEKKFYEEGRLLSRLKHPAIVKVFDLGVEPISRMPYFVMDLVLYADGDSYTLADVDRGDITEELVYKWFKDVASALDYIHDLGIVHRDIKMSNLLLDSNLHAIVTDFGVSRIFGERIKKAVDATMTMRLKTGRGRLVLGTENYIAPEITSGHVATPAADAYSLGVMCFRLLTGGWYERGMKVSLLLSRCKFNWKAVLPKLLAQDPKDRPAKLLELKEILKETYPSLRIKRRVPEKKAKPAIVAAIAAAVTVLVAGLGMWMWHEHSKAEERRQQERLREEDAKRKEERKRKEEDAKRKAEDERRKMEAEAKRKAEDERKKREEEEEERRKAQKDRENKQNGGTSIEKDPNAPVRDVHSSRPAGEDDGQKMDIIPQGSPPGPAVDLGPIPKKSYQWLKNNRADQPKQVSFQLANNAVIDMLPLKAGTFYMTNYEGEGRTHHKVTITRPYWMSKYLVTAEQWREYDKDGCEDCREIEKALVNTGYTVSKAFNRKQIDAYCRDLTKKYRKQLPEGYVFRLPTEAEWEYAADYPAMERNHELDHWSNKSIYWHPDNRKSWDSLVVEKGLDKLCSWAKEGAWWGFVGGWSENENIFIGGRCKPYPRGFYDMMLGVGICLDVSASKGEWWPSKFFDYGMEAVDPLSWVEVDDISKVRQVRRDGALVRYMLGTNSKTVFRLVVGPDLVKERAWETCKKDIPRRPGKNLVTKPSKGFDAKKAKDLRKKQEVSFKMDNDAELMFCACPACPEETFKMSNVPGQEKSMHRIAITQPFWITKYCITAEQWRDFGPFDCEGLTRELETLLKSELKKDHNPYQICVKRNYWQWTAFCKELTKRYEALLPPKYVFRLPTEAELEYAMVANKSGSVDNIKSENFDDNCVDFKKELERNIARAVKRLSNKEYRQWWLDEVRFHSDKITQGLYAECYIGGRTKENAWGVRDIMKPDCACIDCYDSYGLEPQERIEYPAKGKDPLHWDGRWSNVFVHRLAKNVRRFDGFGQRTFAHVVIAPDIVGPLVVQEEQDYPVNDFGGEFLGNFAKVSKLSPRPLQMNHYNSLERHKLLLSLENVIVREHDEHVDLTACHTGKSEDPWVEIAFDKPVEVYGMQIDARRYHGWTHHLRVWIPDGKKWRRVAKDDFKRHRYRFDLKSQKIKTDRIRIGRDPNAKINEAFNLSKILIYGKKQ